MANDKSKWNHEIISTINRNSEQLTFMSPFLEPYNYYTQMYMDAKCGLPLWGQTELHNTVLKRIFGLTETTMKKDCRKLHNHELSIGFST